MNEVSASRHLQFARALVAEDKVLWILIAFIIVINLIWARAVQMRIVLSPAVVVTFVLVVFVYLIYSTIRRDERIAAFALATAQLIAFTSSATVLSYLAVTSKFSLVDAHLVAADRALGLDWLALFMWVQENPWLNRILGLLYGSSIFQIGALLVILNVLKRLDRTREFVWLFVMSLLLIIPLSWVIPAEGAWAYFQVQHLTDAYYLPHFFALRSGEMTEIRMSEVNGLIQFPSFHAALGLILIYAARGIKYVFHISVVLNIGMIAATPTSGGHHFMDVIAGLVVVPLAIVLIRRCHLTAGPSQADIRASSLAR